MRLGNPWTKPRGHREHRGLAGAGRAVTGCCAALIALVLAGCLLFGGGEESFHSIDVEVTPTVPLPGLPAAEIPAGDLERSDLDSLAATTLILVAMAAFTALVSLLGVMASENLALQARRIVEVMLGAPPRTMVRATVRLWARRTLAAVLGGGGLALAAALFMSGQAPPGISFERPSVFVAAAGLAAVAVISALFAIVPVLTLYRAGRSLPHDAENRSVTDPRPRQFNRVLRMTLQLAIAVTVIAASGLLVHSDRSRGFAVSGAGTDALAGVDPERTVVGIVSPAASPDGGAASRAALYESALEAVRGVPELVAESLATPGAWIDVGPESMTLNECGRCSNGGLPEPIRATRVKHHAVMPGFFAERGLRFVAGRGFRAAGAGEVVINRAYALAHFRDPPALGKKVALNGPDENWHVVVGVVTDVPAGGLGASGSPNTVYYSALAHPPAEMELVASVVGGAGGVAGADSEGGAGGEGGVGSRPAGEEHAVLLVQAALASVPGPSLALTRHGSAADELGRIFGTAAWLGGGGRAAGVLAALVAVLGMVGAMRVHVGARMREMGIRAALGAGPARLRRRIFGEAFGIGATGVGMGLWGTMLVVGVVAPPGVEPFSAPVFLFVAVLFLAAVVWAVVPAARLAGKADPSMVMEG